jgi:CRISPR-associated protein Csb1
MNASTHTAANTLKLSDDVLHQWATAPTGPVAIRLRQTLKSVEDVVFPPTYADIGYNIDTLADGTKVVTIDSVGSQANRMEPIFKGADRPEIAALVPQVDVTVSDDLTVSIFDVGHRLGDALFRASDLAASVRAAFDDCLRGDMLQLAKLAPTSILFGAWDSRGSAAKVPRLVQAVIRAWDVQELKRAAQYNPPVDYKSLELFSAEDMERAEGDQKSPLAKRGYVHVPSTGVPGGVVARGPIVRELTINLVALRQLNTAENRDTLREYILGLALVAGAYPIELFLRQGCLLTADADAPSQWVAIHRDGTQQPIELTVERAIEFASARAKQFGIDAPRKVSFLASAARADVAAEANGAKTRAPKSDSKAPKAKRR